MQTGSHVRGKKTLFVTQTISSHWSLVTGCALQPQSLSAENMWIQGPMKFTWIILDPFPGNPQNFHQTLSSRHLGEGRLITVITFRSSDKWLDILQGSCSKTFMHLPHQRHVLLPEASTFLAQGILAQRAYLGYASLICVVTIVFDEHGIYVYVENIHLLDLCI